MTYWKKLIRRANNNRDVVYLVSTNKYRVARFILIPDTHYLILIDNKSKKSIYIGAKGYIEKKVRKSIRGMPWLSEAMKDVISCDKPRGSANMN